MASQLLSFSDLLLVDGWAEAFATDNKVEINRRLYTCGVDITKPWTVEFSEHRNLRGQIVSCDRIVGTERKDPVWIKSGGASEQVKLEQHEGSMFKELAGMGRRGITSAEGTYNSKDYNKTE